MVDAFAFEFVVEIFPVEHGRNWWMFLRVRGGVFLYLFAKIMDSVQMAKCYGGKVWVNLAFY